MLEKEAMRKQRGIEIIVRLQKLGGLYQGHFAAEIEWDCMTKMQQEFTLMVGRTSKDATARDITSHIFAVDAIMEAMMTSKEALQKPRTSGS